MAMTVNKGIGMTDAEWNDIVRQKALDEQQDLQNKKDKINR